MMVRVNFIVEGATEEIFVADVLRPHFSSLQIYCYAHQVTTNRSQLHRGGLVNYEHAKADIMDWVKQEKANNTFFTTMFDLYALPDNFPGYEQANCIPDHSKRVRFLEEQLAQDIGDRRFIPYIQLHEFEALLFADPQQLDWVFLEHDAPIQQLIALSQQFESPEDIDDGRHTAPSKRIIGEIPEYDNSKASAGPLVAARIGLPRLRERCLHFGQWIATLESLTTEQTA